MSTKTIKELAAEKLSKSGESVKEAVAGTIYHGEFNRRVELMANAVQRVDQMERLQKRLSVADHVVKDATGKPLIEGFTDARLKERKKLDEQYAKLTKAVDQAFADPPNWQPLTEVMKQPFTPGKPEPEAETAAD